MGNLLLNGQTAFTQTGTAAPVLASTVNLSSATFPAGHVIQVQQSVKTDADETRAGVTASGFQDITGTDQNGSGSGFVSSKL